jgi:hypothetical protein
MILTRFAIRCAHECCKIGCRHAPKKRKNNVISSPTLSHNKQSITDEPSPKARKIQTVDTQELEQRVYQDSFMPDECDLLEQSWLEAWDIDDLDLISVVDLCEDNSSELQQMTIEDKKDDEKEVSDMKIENLSTKAKIHDT